jgi:hypothetical protein
MKTFKQFIIESDDRARQAYFDKIYKVAKNSGDKFPEVVAAQAALESGWGSSPSGKNNYFGQKASGNEKSSSRQTSEFGSGGMYSTSANFKDYDNENASIKDRINKWSYKYGDAKDVDTAVSRLQLPGGSKIPGSKETSHGAYATDPDYTSKISGIAKEYRSRIKDETPKAPAKPTSVAAKTTPSAPKTTPTAAKPTPAPKPFTRQVIQDKGGKGGTVSTNTAYNTKLGGSQATSTRGLTGNQVIRANLGTAKTGTKDQKVAGTLGGVKGTIDIKGGNKSFIATKPAPAAAKPAPAPAAAKPAPAPAAAKPAPAAAKPK